MHRLKFNYSNLPWLLVILGPLALWAMILLGISAGNPRLILTSTEPLHYLLRIRSVLPIAAGSLAMALIFAKLLRHQHREFSFLGPLAFAAAYGSVGIIASVFSPNGSLALFWVALYLSVPLVLWAIVWGPQPLDHLRRIINVTWLVVIFLSLVFFTVAILYLELGSIILEPSLWLQCPLNAADRGVSWFGLASGALRPTGVGRIAAVGALIALGGLWQRNWRLLSAAILFVCLMLLFTSGARTALIGFGAAAVFMVLMYGGKKAAIVGVLIIPVLLALFWIPGVHHTFVGYCILRGGGLVEASVVERQTPGLIPSVLLILAPEPAETPTPLPATVQPPTPSPTIAGESATSGDIAGDSAPLPATVQPPTPSPTIAGESATSGDIAGDSAPSATLAPAPTASPALALPPVAAMARTTVSPTLARPPTTSRTSAATGTQALAPIVTDQPSQSGGSALASGRLTVTEGEDIGQDSRISEIPSPPSLAVTTESSKSWVLGPLFTLTGRTHFWAKGIELFKDYPVLGRGFHADRLVLGGHIHNTYLAALVQTGLIGTTLLVTAFLFAWIILVKLMRNLNRLPLVHKHLVIQAGAVLVLLSVRTIPESTGAFYGIDWLLLAPIFLYLHTVYHTYLKVESQT